MKQSRSLWMPWPDTQPSTWQRSCSTTPWTLQLEFHSAKALAVYKPSSMSVEQSSLFGSFQSLGLVVFNPRLGTVSVQESDLCEDSKGAIKHGFKGSLRTAGSHSPCGHGLTQRSPTEIHSGILGQPQNARQNWHYWTAHVNNKRSWR